MEAHSARLLERFERAYDRHQLHAVIGRRRFPAVDLCRCKYCGTPQRIEYRQQVARELAHD